MWIDIVLRSIVIILIWVAIWGLAEMAIDALSDDKSEIRVLLYFSLLLFGVVCLYLLEASQINL